MLNKVADPDGGRVTVRACNEVEPQRGQVAIGGLVKLSVSPRVFLVWEDALVLARSFLVNPSARWLNPFVCGLMLNRVEGGDG
jgi:hypothetical protein